MVAGCLGRAGVNEGAQRVEGEPSDRLAGAKEAGVGPRPEWRPGPAAGPWAAEQHRPRGCSRPRALRPGAPRMLPVAGEPGEGADGRPRAGPAAGSAVRASGPWMSPRSGDPVRIGARAGPGLRTRTCPRPTLIAADSTRRWVGAREVTVMERVRARTFRAQVGEAGSPSLGPGDSRPGQGRRRRAWTVGAIEIHEPASGHGRPGGSGPAARAAASCGSGASRGRGRGHRGRISSGRPLAYPGVTPPVTVLTLQWVEQRAK